MYFDNFLVGVQHGNIIEENHYYAYGLKIAAISSRKLGSSYEGKLKNNYLYQGAFSELDEDIGWNDYALRNYDAQTGRWVQQDPYQEFATPYTYVGNDPINFTDPTGGLSWPPPGLSKLFSVASSTTETVSKVLQVGNQAAKAASILSKASIAITLVKTATDVINKGTETKQIGRTFRTPDGGAITLPEGATNLSFNDNSGTNSFSGHEDLGDFRVYPGSLKGFDFEGRHYEAFYSYDNATFDRYGTNTLGPMPEDISYRTPQITVWSQVGVTTPDVQQASGAAISIGTRMPGGPQAKAATALFLVGTGVVTTMVVWKMTTYYFEMVYPSTVVGGYIETIPYAEQLVESIKQFAEHIKNKRKSSWNKHTKRRSGRQYDKSQNSKRGAKNKKFKPKPNPNKR